MNSNQDAKDDEKIVVGRFANLLVYNPNLMHKILQKYFTNTAVLEYFSLCIFLKEDPDATTASFKTVLISHAFELDNPVIETKLEKLHTTFEYISGLLSEHLTNLKTRLDEDLNLNSNLNLNLVFKKFILIPVTINFGRDLKMLHQCFFIVTIDAFPTVRYFDPYGRLFMFNIDYEANIKYVSEKMFPKCEYMSSNISKNMQTNLLNLNNLKFKSGEFTSRLLELAKVANVSKTTLAKLLKQTTDDEKDNTIASLTLLEDRKLPLDASFYKLFYDFSSKTCVSLSLIVLYHYTNRKNMKFDDHLKNLYTFLTTDDEVRLLDMKIPNKKVVQLFNLK